jgi:anti-sigma factor RsiW
MNHVPFGESACERTRKYLDSYISNELLVETNHDVLSHLENCSACSAELNARVQLRLRLKSAVKSQGVPPELEARIREQIRARGAHGWFDGWTRWAVAVAASLVVCSGIWWNYTREHMPALSDRPAQAAYIQKVSANLAAILRVGLRDHIHCSVFRKYPKNPPPVEQMEEKLGPSYRGLLPLVRAAVPDGYRVIMAHQCGYAGRKYIHLTLEKNGNLLSLVIARKNDGESLDGLRAATQSSGVSIYQSAAGRYQVAGFEAGNFLAYVVSDLQNQANLRIAASLAPGVNAFLIKTA